MDVGRSIRMLRVARGMKQGELAERVGVSISCISKLERDKCSVSLKTAQSLAAALDLDLVSLVYLMLDEAETHDLAPEIHGAISMHTLKSLARKDDNDASGP